MRIVAGERKGTRLAAPRGRGAGPTTDRVREALFAMLGDVAEATVLDPFAGRGALGFEALSRGVPTSRSATVDRAALAAVRENVGRLGYADRCACPRQDARRRLGGRIAAAGAPTTWCSSIPPYTMLTDLHRHMTPISGDPCSRRRARARAGGRLTTPAGRA